MVNRSGAGHPLQTTQGAVAATCAEPGWVNRTVARICERDGNRFSAFGLLDGLCFVRRGDLADRGVFLHLPPIIPSKRRAEGEFWGTFRELRPTILGGLLDAVALAVRELPSVHLAEMPRMADFAQFGEAVGRGLGWPPETFLAAYLENRQQATLSTLEDSILANMLLKQVENGFGLMEWSMPASEMLATLTLSLDRRIARSPSWPKTPAMFGNELRWLAPTLAERGLFVMSKRTEKARLIILTTRPERHLPEPTIETNIPGG
jgi:putative DNA primase/helicase